MSVSVFGLRHRLFWTPSSANQDAVDPLVAALRAGNAHAVAEAYDKHHAQVRGFARRLLGDDAAAEDLVHDVFVALPDAITRFRGESSLLTFLLSIAVNHSRGQIRTAVRRRRALERLALEPLAQREDPEDQAARQQLADALTRALDTLPDEQRVAFVLCEVEERTSADVAAIVGVPEGTVRTRVFHARRKLREWFEREGAR
jgi:RNA polymerase sigma-70 factor (ECF subfamily)